MILWRGSLVMVNVIVARGLALLAVWQRDTTNLWPTHQDTNIHIWLIEYRSIGELLGGGCYACDKAKWFLFKLKVYKKCCPVRRPQSEIRERLFSSIMVLSLSITLHCHLINWIVKYSTLCLIGFAVLHWCFTSNNRKTQVICLALSLTPF